VFLHGADNRQKLRQPVACLAEKLVKRYDTVYLRAMISGWDGQLNLAHCTETKKLGKTKTE